MDGARWHEACYGYAQEEVRHVTMSSEIEPEVESFEARVKSSARRRVDAYHEALREQATLRDLEQPFVLDMRAWPPPRY